MSTGAVIAIVVVVVVVAAVVAIAAMEMRRRRLRQQFGPEYDRLATELGSRRKAEAELAARQRRVAQLDIRPLTREEGARYNLGNMRSTLGNPVLALGVLQQSYQQRFRFVLGKEDRGFGPGVAVVDYKEVQSPAMIRGEAGRDLPAHGRVWIDTATGRVSG